MCSWCSLSHCLLFWNCDRKHQWISQHSLNSLKTFNKVSPVSQPGNSLSSEQSVSMAMEHHVILLCAFQTGWLCDFRYIWPFLAFYSEPHSHFACDAHVCAILSVKNLCMCVHLYTFSMLCWCRCSLSRSVGMATLMNFCMGGSRRRSWSLPASSTIMTVTYDLFYKVRGSKHPFIHSLVLKKEYIFTYENKAGEKVRNRQVY